MSIFLRNKPRIFINIIYFADEFSAIKLSCQ